MRRPHHRIAFELLEDRRQPGDLLFAAAPLFGGNAAAAIVVLPPELSDAPVSLFEIRRDAETDVETDAPARRVAKSAPSDDSFRKPTLDLISSNEVMVIGNTFTAAEPVRWTAAAPRFDSAFTPASGAVVTDETVAVVGRDKESSTQFRRTAEDVGTASQSLFVPTYKATATETVVKSNNDLHYIVNGQPVALSPRTDRVTLTLTDSTPATLAAVEAATGLHRIRGIQGSTGVFEGAGASDLLSKSVVNVTAAVPVFRNGSRDSVVLNQVIVALNGTADPAAVFADAVAHERLGGTTDQYVVTVAGSGVAAIDAANRFRDDPRVQWSEPNFYDDLRPQSLPNDSMIASQWHFANAGQSGGVADADTDADLAWDLNPGGTPNRLISVVDDGIEITHPDLNIWTNPGEIAGNSLDDDGNGYTDDINGWNFVTNTNQPQASTAADAHGTNTSGLAAARGDNALGVAGVSYKAQVLPVRIFDYTNSISLANLATAVYYAAGRNKSGTGSFASVSAMNNSYGGGALSAAVQVAYAWATVHGRGDLGTVAVCATGNDGVTDAIYPAHYSLSNTGLIGVGASTNLDKRASYSNSGGGLDVMAPSSGGTLGLVTTTRLGANGSDYTAGFGGTSGATPIVTGTAALILSQADAKGVTLTATQVRSILQNTTDLIGGATYRTDTGRNVDYGTGRINAFTAVDGVGKPEISVTSTAADLASGAMVNVGTTIVNASRTTTLRIRNQGTSDLTLGSVSITGSSAFTVDSVSASVLKLGESGTVTLRYAPTLVGSDSGTVTITSNDADEGAFTLQLAGTGVAGNITGSAFEDRNGNGVRDTGEAGVAGRTVFLDANGNGTFDRFTQTAAPNVAIPDASFAGVANTIAVGGLTGAVSNISVTLNVTHPYVGDLVVALSSPAGGTINLSNHGGGAGQNFSGTTFSDAAAIEFGNGFNPFTGSFRPIVPLATYDGLSPNGNWTLTIADPYTGDMGTFLDWTLAFDTEAKTVSDSQGLFGFGNLAAGTYSVAQVTPAGWTATTTAKSVTLPSNTSTVAAVALGTAKNNRVYGTVFNDTNANGVLNSGEPGVSGRTVFADTNGNGTLDTFTPVTVMQVANLTIPDNNLAGTTSTLSVSGQTGTLADLDVSVTLRHNYVGDVKLTLVSPTNQSIVLSNLRGSFGTNMIGTIFDSQATVAIAGVNENQAPFRGRFTPENSLNTVNGTSPNGTWKLIAADLGPDDTGTLESWGITFRTGTTEQSALTDALGQYALDVPAVATNIVTPPVAGFTFTTPATGVQTVTAAGAPAYAKNFGVLDAPVVVTPLIVNDGSAQRSRVTSVTVRFSEPVQFSGPAANAFAVSGPPGGVAFTAAVDNSNPYTLVTLSFSAPLPVDGKYAVTVNPALVADLASNALIAPGPLTVTRIFGDLDGNGTVNTTDLAAFGNAFNSVTGQGAYRIEADANLDGVIDIADLTEFGNHFGVSF